MRRVLIRGPLLSSSGYGVHSRQIFSYFLNRGDCDVRTQILPWGITPWCVNDKKEGGIYGQIMSLSGPIDSKFDVSVQIQLPNEWDHNLAHYNVGVTAGVETDKCPVQWATVDRERMNLVVVPSSHTRLTFLSSATGREKTPIVTVPEAYYDEILEEPATEVFNFQTKKNFLTVGMITADDPDVDRKNLINTVKWFCQEFDGDENVGLVVKASKGRETTIDRELVRKSLHAAIQNSGAVKPPRVYMLHGSMTRQDMTALYKHPSICGLVSATRGEGFGLPMLEAAVAGLPVLCTNWSSITDFLEGPSFVPVDYDLVQIPPHRVDDRIFVKGSRWASPREASFKKKLRKLLKDEKTLKLEAKNLSEILKNSHSLETLSKKYDEIFSKALPK